MALKVVLERVVNCFVFHEASHIRHISHQRVGAGKSSLVRVFFPLIYLLSKHTLPNPTA